MLIGNYSVLQKSPNRWLSGSSVSDVRANVAKNGMRQSRFYPRTGNSTPLAGLPYGYRPPYTWHLPIKSGALVSHGLMRGSSTVTSTGQLGLPGTVTISGSSSITATGGLIVSATVTINGTGTITTDLVGVASGVPTISGSSTISASNYGIGVISATVNGSSTLAATLIGIGHMAVTIYINEGQATIDQIVDGVVDGIGSITATIPDLLNTETGDIIIPLA